MKRMVKINKLSDNKLSEMFNNFMEIKEAQGIGDKTNYDYQTQLKKFIDASHNTTAYNVLEADTIAFFRAIPDTSPARFNKPYQYVNAFLGWMEEEGIIPKNPLKANHIKKKQDDGNIKPVAPEDLQKFLKVINKTNYTGLRNHCIANVMLDCGIRSSEILALKNSDYNFTDRSITIRKDVAKTKTGRIVYLLPATCTLINQFIAIKSDDWQDWLFPNYEGRQLTIQKLDKAFKEYSEKSGIKITPYQLRHSFATSFLKNGGNVLALQKIMGHTDLKMTKRYTELDTAYLQEQHDIYSPASKLHTTRIKKLK